MTARRVLGEITNIASNTGKQPLQAKERNVPAKSGGSESDLIEQCSAKILDLWKMFVTDHGSYSPSLSQLATGFIQEVLLNLTQAFWTIVTWTWTALRVLTTGCCHLHPARSGHIWHTSRHQPWLREATIWTPTETFPWSFLIVAPPRVKQGLFKPRPEWSSPRNTRTLGFEWVWSWCSCRLFEVTSKA